MTTFNISGHGGDALRETAIPRLDSQLVKAAFQQLKNTDEEIQASISEVAARQLEAEGPESAVQEVGEGVQDQADGLSAQETGEVAETAASEPLDAGLETAAPEDIIQETVLQESASEEVVQEAVPEPSSQEPIQEEVVQKPVQEPVKQETAQQAASPKTPAPAAAPAPPTAPPGLEALMSATPEQLAAMMAYLQTLQAAKAPAAPVEAAKPEPTIPEAPKEPQQVSEIVASESSIPASPSADAVAAMSQPLEPTEQVSAAAHAAESPALESTPAEDVLSRSFEDEEDDFFVEPIDKDPGPLVEKAEQSLKTEPQLELEQQPEQQPELHTRPEPEPEPENAPLLEPLESAVRDSAVDVMEPAKQIDSLESVVEEEEERAPSGQETETSSVDDSVEAAMNDSVEAAINDELAKVDLEAHAKELDLNEEVAKMDMELIDELKGEPDEQLTGELNAVILGDNPEPSRLPRNVSSYYLQPLRRVAEYGVPSCDLQLRSYSVRPLESFCDFALRAAYYLGLPAYGPVPLPKIIQRWTVPRSHFIFKKSQENFERITRRRLIQIKDGNPETVQIWLAFLQKHQQAAVGLKANLWEFSSIGMFLSFAVY